MVHVATADSWTCPGCGETVGRRATESEYLWRSRRKALQLDHGGRHPGTGGAR